MQAEEKKKKAQIQCRCAETRCPNCPVCRNVLILPEDSEGGRLYLSNLQVRMLESQPLLSISPFHVVQSVLIDEMGSALAKELKQQAAKRKKQKDEEEIESDKSAFCVLCAVLTWR